MKTINKGDLVLKKYKFGEILRVYKESCYINWLNGGQSKEKKESIIVLRLPSFVTKIGKYYTIKI